MPHLWDTTDIAGDPPMRLYRCGRCGLAFTITLERSIDHVAAPWPCRADQASGPAIVPAAAPEALDPKTGAGQPPGLVRQAVHYTIALGKWVIHGMPTRPIAEIERILAVCQACDRYNSATQRCRYCGCKANDAGQAWVNKIAMATEKCPLRKW